MVTFNYDGDFNALNNWDNLGSPTASFQAVMYTTVSESASHYFIYYVSFHPRNCLNSILSGPEHENDAEGAIMLVRKDGTQFGSLEAMTTVFHGEWRSYTNDSSRVTRGSQNQGNPALMFNFFWSGSWHPGTYQEPQGHGMVGCAIGSTDCGLTGNDSIRYVPVASGAGIPPFPVTDGTIHQVNYVLLDLGILFDRRLDRPTFSSATSIAGGVSGGCGTGGNGCATNAAGGIWRHNQDGVAADDNNGAGEDPAGFFSAMFSFSGGLTAPSSQYYSNKLLHQKCEVGRRLQGSPDQCAQFVMIGDLSCRDNTWSQACVNQVASVCGAACATFNPNTQVTTSHCTASICQVQDPTNGGPIERGCDGRCAAAVCAADSYCCDVNWDTICVAEVSSICGISCPSYWKSASNANWPNGARCASESHAMGGFTCLGANCTTMGVECRDIPYGRLMNPTWDPTTFSEEGINMRTCTSGKVITGLRCNNTKCDNISLECSDVVGGGQVVTSDCDWERSPNGTVKMWSEEQSGSMPPNWSMPATWEESNGGIWPNTFNFTSGRFAVMAQCTGQFCDNMGFYTCRIGPSAP